MIQREEVLRLLRERGSRGVHTFELRRAYIGNPSQRIADLEALGHVISSRREKLNGEAVGARYVLVRDAGTLEAVSSSVGTTDPSAGRTTPPRAPERLFDAPLNAALSDWEEAA